jgi:hypothetical protein
MSAGPFQRSAAHRRPPAPLAQGAGGGEGGGAEGGRPLPGPWVIDREARPAVLAIANPGIATTVAGSANPANVRAWARWAAEPLDEELVRDVQAIFAPVKNIGHVEGLPENN